MDIPIRQRKKYCGTTDLRLPSHLEIKENVPPEDAQKGQTSHPPNPGAPRRAVPRARPQRAITLLRGGWDDPNCAQHSHPPTHWHAETCHLPWRGPSDSPTSPEEVGRLFFTARIFPFPHLIFRGSLVDPRLRASNEHILIVRVPRAGGRPGYPSHPSEAARCASTGIVPATPSPLFSIL
jgi:hypothetical protein